MGRYTASIAAERADQLRLTAIGVWPVEIGYSYLFSADDHAMEDRVEQEVLDQFGGYKAMIEMFEAELVCAKSITASEAIIYLRSFSTRDEPD